MDANAVQSRVGFNLISVSLWQLAICTIVGAVMSIVALILSTDAIKTVKNRESSRILKQTVRFYPSKAERGISRKQRDSNQLKKDKQVQVEITQLDNEILQLRSRLTELNQQLMITANDAAKKDAVQTLFDELSKHEKVLFQLKRTFTQPY
ncbi:hypothetical protein HDE_03217 [Halotydeus destructor]|nr:hypothetical protein HDE_03217 [Halotydeus destructor]